MKLSVPVDLCPHASLTCAVADVMVDGQVQVLAILTHRQSPYFLFAGRFGGKHSRLNHYGEEKNLLSLLGIEVRFFGLPVHCLVTTFTELLNPPEKGK
jgi:hypothetical protein